MQGGRVGACPLRGGVGRDGAAARPDNQAGQVRKKVFFSDFVEYFTLVVPPDWSSSGTGLLLILSLPQSPEHLT